MPALALAKLVHFPIIFPTISSICVSCTAICLNSAFNQIIGNCQLVLANYFCALIWIQLLADSLCYAPYLYLSVSAGVKFAHPYSVFSIYMTNSQLHRMKTVRNQVDPFLPLYRH